ncbi:hypothetical protein RB195_016420 [Necator americanus]|uniref:Glucuronosyltransferase n=1 Tax=Necator americanus TaxID=51031 RepID=A0ABR1C2V9_NECAM
MAEVTEPAINHLLMSIPSLVSIIFLFHYRVLASNILVWSPRIGLSHVNFLGNIADILTTDGHNVTIYASKLDPHITTFGNRLSAHTILFEAEGVATKWLDLE